MKHFRKYLLRITKILLVLAGVIFILSCILAFTTLPFHARHWLGTSRGTVQQAPDIIILMGGAGFPSEDGLLRCYFASALALKYPGSKLVIALPGDTTDSTGASRLMRAELMLRGIRSDRIEFENQGRNTRQQAMQFAARYTPTDTLSLAVVTSPEHMYRSILCFNKVGFRQVKGFPTTEISINDEYLYFNDRDLKGNKAVPPIGHNTQFRYQFWNHLEYEILVAREWFAILYYKLRSWI